MNFDFSELTGNLLKVHNAQIAFRSVAFCDGWPLFESTKNPLFNKHLMWPQPQADHETLQRIDLIMDAVDRGKISAVSAVVKDTGEWIGLFKFQPHDSGDKNIEFGFWSRDKFWNGRHGFDVCDLCVDEAFRSSDVERVVAASSPENRPSCVALQRGGLKPGRIVVRTTEDNRPLELKEFSIERSQWDQRGKVSVRDFLHSMKKDQTTLPSQVFQSPAQSAQTTDVLEVA